MADPRRRARQFRARRRRGPGKHCPRRRRSAHAAPTINTSAAAPDAAPRFAASVDIHYAVNWARVRTGAGLDYRVIGYGNAGGGMTADCWTQGDDGFIWFHGTVWGGPAGFSRVDMFAIPDADHAEEVLDHC